MKELKLNNNLKSALSDFVESLEGICADNLISVILYGSAASGEFIDKHSNLNLLVVLKNAGLENLKPLSGLINKRCFRIINPLIFSEEYIQSSTDVFPIEFLDMKENYTVLVGQDILKDISIDTKNLTYQCEHELKSKLIALRLFFLRNNKDRLALLNFLLQTFTSTLHVLRNIIRLRQKTAHYLKMDILEDIIAEFQTDKDTWETILAVKNKQIKLRAKQIDTVFTNFVRDLEKIVGIIDKL
jgi:hypothetical protein